MEFRRKCSFYEKYIKRLLDIFCSSFAIIVFSWLYMLIAILVRIKLGSPVFFKQPRPGMIDPKNNKEKIFYMYKFRTMTDAKDEKGQLLSDKARLTPFGKKLRATSLDELPEAFNILKGDMSVIGPRPQLVRDMVFMTDEQRMRHTAKPGLSGLAQVMGRNAISWEDKLNWDLKYIEKVSFLGDLKIVFMTIKKVFFRSKLAKSDTETDVTLDFGDALLQEGRITLENYKKKQVEAKKMLNER